MSSKLSAAIRMKILQVPQVVAIIGQQVFPGEAPYSADLPYVIYRLNSSDRSPRMTGGIVKKTLTCECVANTYAMASQIADEIKAGINDWGGVLNGVNIRAIFVDDETDEIELPEEGEEKATHTKTIDFTVWYREDAN